MLNGLKHPIHPKARRTAGRATAFDQVHFSLLLLTKVVLPHLQAASRFTHQNSLMPVDVVVGWAQLVAESLFLSPFLSSMD